MTTEPTAEVGLRERKKDATRRALAEHALHLARERGYDGFTIADLVAEVDVSRRTFSNYFSSKAECIAAVTEGWLDDVLESISEAPADASLAEVLQTGLMMVAHQGTERWGLLQPLIDSEPEVAAHCLAADGRIVEIAAEQIAIRARVDRDDIRVRLLADFAITAGREVITRWAASGQSGGDVELARLMTAAFSILDPSGLISGPLPADHTIT